MCLDEDIQAYHFDCFAVDAYRIMGTGAGLDAVKLAIAGGCAAGSHRPHRGAR